MQKSILLLAGAAMLATSLAAGAAERCQFSVPRSAEIDASGLKLLSVQIGPDELAIHGEPGVSQITVTGTACASDQKWLDDIKVETTRQGDQASVVARDGRHDNIFSLFGNSYAYLKLDVRVPQSLAVKLMQGSGDATAHGLAALAATLGSGDLKVNSVAGEFRASVGSGDLVANDVGSLELSSLGSGDVEVDGVRGDAHVGSVGSGNFKLGHAKGSVTIGSIGSGDVKLDTVGGSVKADSVGSGDLVIQGVTGGVAVGAVSSGEVRITQAGGNVHAGSVGSGDFSADGVGGDFSVDAAGSGDISHRNVKGKVRVPRRND